MLDFFKDDINNRIYFCDVMDKFNIGSYGWNLDSSLKWRLYKFLNNR